MSKAPDEIAAAGILLDVVVVGSVACISYGAWLAYQPAGFIVGGLLMLALALGLAAGAADKKARAKTRIIKGLD